ncbi:MAG: PKD domain-containing protein [Caldilineaceae bacterium]
MIQEADLTVEPIDVLGEVVAASITYVISAWNNGPSVANNTVFTFSIEPGVTLSGLDVNQGTCSGVPLVTCVLDVLLPSQRAVVTATGSLDPALTGVVTATAAVRSDTTDLTPVFDDRTRVDTVITRAKLTLRNQPASSQAVSGQDNVLFNLVVNNLGPSLARAVVITNVLPISTTANQITAPNGVSCGPLARTIVCDVGDLNAGAPITVSVRAAVNADAVGTLVNRASVASAVTAQLDVDSAPVTTIQRADLRVAKTAAVADVNNNAAIDVGERITYTVVVTNAGPSNASGVVISDRVPSLLGSVVVLPSQGSFAVDLWTVGSLAAGKHTTLTVSALLGDATSGQTITNTALIQAADQTDPVTNNNSAAVIFAVSPAADLAVAMTVSAAAPQVLDTITYYITATNNGPEDATGVSVTDVLPFALTYLSHSPGASAYDDVSGIWQIGDLGVGQQRSLSITARVVGSGNVVNSAAVTGTLIDPNAANDTAAAPIVVGQAADLRLSQSFSDNTPNVDDDLVIVVTLSNDGPDTATGVVISYPVPPLLAGAAVSPQGSAVYTATSGLWTIPSLASGASTTLTVRRTLDRSGSFSSVAEVLSSNLFDPDSTPGNGTGNGEDDETRVSVTVPPAADVAVTKSANAGPFKEGDTVSYTLLARNNGPDTATNVVITDTLPITLLTVLQPTISIAGDDLADSSFVFYETAQPGIITGTLVWNVGTMPNADTETLFLSLTVQPNTAGRTITDGTDGLQADQYDWNPANNLSALVPIVIDGADLNVTKDVSNDRPNVNETLIYTLTVTNNGPTDTTNVRVVDQLPASLTYVGNTVNAGGNYDNLTGLWTVPALAAQQTATLLLTTTVDAGLTEQVITNTVTSAVSDVADGDQSNNTPSAVISVQRADLRVSIQPQNLTPYEGQITTFFIVVENTGPDVATSVVLTHALPISLTNRGGAPTQGTYTLAQNRWNVGELAVGSSARLSFFAEPIASSGGQTIALTVADLTLEQEDPTPTVTAQGVITVLGSDLRIPQITISDSTPATGNQVRYTATVENLGPSANSNVILTQTVPAGTTFVAAEPGATVVGGDVAWRLSLAAGASATRYMTVTINSTAGASVVASAVTASGLITTPDNLPLNNSNSLTVTVNQPPLITLSALPTVAEGSIFNVNGIFTDTDSPSIQTAQVNYGDGSGVQTLTINQTPSTGSVTGNFTLNHRYADGGVYTITVTLTDSDSNTGTLTQPVTIQNAAPAVTARADITSGVVEGTNYTANNIVTFTDAGYSALSTTETFTYSINWGDGSTLVTGAVTGVVNGSAGVATSGAVNAAHTYADNGVYAVTVTIFDDDGGSNADSLNITVANAPRW